MEKTTDTIKKAVKKTAAKPAAVKKVRAKKEVAGTAVDAPAVKPAKKTAANSDRYTFATGRRKTSVANIRLFAGSEKFQVNRKPFEQYFFDTIDRESALKPLEATGLAGTFWFTAQVSGGGIHAQATAVSHGLARALAEANPESRLVLKKNGFLTRDDRKKERKKPGLRRARRAPQWAKR
jgi:small subunit ribosomal protein S9